MKWLYFAATVAAFQIPLNLKWSSEPVRAHYSTLDVSDHPINLSQYENQMVVRLVAGPELYLYLAENKYKVWARNTAAGTVDVQLNSTQLEQLGEFAQDSKLVIADLAQAVFETYPENMGSEFAAFSERSTREVTNASDANVLNEVFFKLYRPLESIDAWLELLQLTYPQYMTTEEIGTTHEGRTLKVVHVSVPDDDIRHGDKKTVVITGGVHAREWISVSTVLYCIYSMLEHYETNPEQWKELAKLDFLFIPVLNPDGYEHSWTTDRLWRKNRQPVEGGNDSNCMGIDIDHSYDYHWTRSSDTACGEEYAGSEPFEANELRVWNEYLNATNSDHKIWGYIDLHSYSQEILYPYAYSCSDQPRDEENLIELAYGISKAVRLTSGKYYAVLPACLDRDLDLIPDLGAGTALDFMYHHRVFWAFQMKLRDSGSHGFLLPEKYIRPVGEEIAAGLKYFCRFILLDERL